MSPLFELEGSTIWALAALVAIAIVLPYLIAFRLRRSKDRDRLAEARDLGIDRPVAQFPYIDPLVCIGCGACARACPEGDVLGVVGGVAVVVNGLRCVGHGRCAEACPVGAIEIGMGDTRGRKDVPLLTDELESTVPGVFVAGELTGLALIRNAVAQGVAVVDTIAARLRATPTRCAVPDEVDVLIVGAGPAGLAAALAARERGISYRIVDQGAGLGGTILQFPSRKMVLTRPVALPGGGALAREVYSKEEVLDLLHREIDARGLRVFYGERLERLAREGDSLVVDTSKRSHRARHVVLALGRRGTPRKLGVPGEEGSQVSYQLRDAESWRDQSLLVVGGGDSAIEAAIGLARQTGNRVTLSYRKNAFYRIKRKNQEAIEKLIASGQVRAAFESEVESLEPGRATLRSGERREMIAADAVFVLVGGDPPFELLRRCGLRFGGEDTAPPAAARSRGPAPTTAALAIAIAAFGLAGAPASAQDSPHGDLAISCSECHTTADWKEVGREIPFRHDSVGLPLAGRHAAAACAQCHSSPVFSRVATTCADCHRDPHKGELGLSCSSCHDTRRWDVRSEMLRAHSTTLFPLLAAHARVDCDACHGEQPPEQFALTPTDCISCHRPEYQATRDPNHVAAGFPVGCQACHSIAAWTPASFDHAASRFPLTGAHRTVACASCHDGGVFTGTPRDCVSCHRTDYERTRDPNHVAAGFPTTCEGCHETARWEGATFDHDARFFPINSGVHRGTWASCSTCHVAAGNLQVFSCVGCHEHRRSEMDDEHDDVRNYRYESQACYGCHPNGRE